MKSRQCCGAPKRANVPRTQQRTQWCIRWRAIRCRRLSQLVLTSAAWMLWRGWRGLSIAVAWRLPFGARGTHSRCGSARLRRPRATLMLPSCCPCTCDCSALLRMRSKSGPVSPALSAASSPASSCLEKRGLWVRSIAPPPVRDRGIVPCREDVVLMLTRGKCRGGVSIRHSSSGDVAFHRSLAQSL